MLALAMTAMTFTSCEDVPSQYDDPNNALPSGVFLKETFASGLGSFTVVTPKGTPWVNKFSTMTATGYNSTTKKNTESESYLLSPELNLSSATAAYIQFKYIYRYSNKVGADSVLITTNYTGDPKTTKWSNITGKLTEGSNWEDFSTYQLQLNSSYLTKGVRIALYYNSTDSTSRTWEVKNFYVLNGTAPKTGSDTSTPDSLGSSKAPVTVAEALKAVNSASPAERKAYVKGIVSKVDKVDTGKGDAIYYISDDGKSSNEIEIYYGFGLNGKSFTSADDIKVGDKVTVYGTIKYYASSTFKTTEFISGSKLLAFEKGGSTSDLLNETFASSLGKFAVQNVQGSLATVWSADTKNGYAKASAYVNKVNEATESWLISPAIDLSKSTVDSLNFSQCLNFLKTGDRAEHVSVMISTDYITGLPNSGTWTELTLDAWTDGKSWTWTNNKISLKAYAKNSNVHIAFKYVSTTEIAPTWEIKNVVVK